MPQTGPKIETSILILTHNAPVWVEETIVTLDTVTAKVQRERSEVIVLDNASREETRTLLERLKQEGRIDKLHFSEENTFFARGNNLAAAMGDPQAKYILLLNSDVRIDDPLWLEKLIRYKEEGGYAAASYGRCENPDRADGYCLLIDRALYMKYGLDEDFPWWGGTTKLQYQLLEEGCSILAIDNHDDIVYHYGGKSGRSYKAAGKPGEEYRRIMSGFGALAGKVTVLDLRPSKSVFARKMKKVKALLKRM